MRRQADRGLTIPEILVSSFIVFLIVGMVSIVMLQLKSQAHRSEAVLTARYDLQLLFKELDDAFDQTTSDSFHAAADLERFSIQTIDGLSLNGTRAWSPFVTFFSFDEDKRQVVKGQVELSEIQKVHNPKLPAAITDEDLDKMLQVRRADGKLRPVASQIDEFEVERPNPLSVRVTLAAVLKSGKYKDESVVDERLFFFSSAADL